MNAARRLRAAATWTATGVVLGVGAYAAYVAAAWARYGHAAPPAYDERDSLLDAFMADPDVAERHRIRIDAPPDVVLAAAKNADMQRAVLVRAIFRARELVLGASPGAATRPRGLLATLESLGWRVLAERPGRELVVGAATRPWMADVVFRGLAPEEFRTFREPGYVKIAWTLRADPDGDGGPIFRTETRATATDASARRRFRWYWARFSPGIVLIRRVLIRQVRYELDNRVIG
jgi:hypothetical protein